MVAGRTGAALRRFVHDGGGRVVGRQWPHPEGWTKNDIMLIIGASAVQGYRGEMVKTTLRILIAIGLTAGGAVVSSPAAHAGADHCTHATLTMPSRVVVASRSQDLNSGKVSTDCLNWEAWSYGQLGFQAVWRAVGSDGLGIVDSRWHPLGSEPFIIWSIPPAHVDDSMRLGRWVWRPWSGFTAGDPDHEYTVLSLPEMNTPATDVRVGSVNYVAAVRHGGRVTVTTRAVRYWTSTHAFGIWAGARGLIQYRVPGQTTWHPLKNVYSDGYGRYSYTYTTSATREYRAIMWDATYVWGAASARTALR